MGRVKDYFEGGYNFLAASAATFDEQVHPPPVKGAQTTGRDTPADLAESFLWFCHDRMDPPAALPGVITSGWRSWLRERRQPLDGRHGGGLRRPFLLFQFLGHFDQAVDGGSFAGGLAVVVEP
jgi:hypothetical protein